MLRFLAQAVVAGMSCWQTPQIRCRPGFPQAAVVQSGQTYLALLDLFTPPLAAFLAVGVLSFAATCAPSAFPTGATGGGGADFAGAVAADGASSGCCDGSV